MSPAHYRKQEMPEEIEQAEAIDLIAAMLDGEKAKAEYLKNNFAVLSIKDSEK